VENDDDEDGGFDGEYRAVGLLMLRRGTGRYVDDSWIIEVPQQGVVAWGLTSDTLSRHTQVSPKDGTLCYQPIDLGSYCT
jgi:hypothetical protein